MILADLVVRAKNGDEWPMEMVLPLDTIPRVGDELAVDLCEDGELHSFPVMAIFAVERVRHEIATTPTEEVGKTRVRHHVVVVLRPASQLAWDALTLLRKEQEGREHATSEAREV